MGWTLRAAWATLPAMEMHAMSGSGRRAATQRWVVDPARSAVEFRVGNVWGLTTVVGRFTRFDGTYTVGSDGPSVALDVRAESLDTGNRRRDAHLRSRDFFDVARHPRVRFTADEVTDSGDGTLRVRGDLDAAGRSVPLSLEATVREHDGELEIEATTQVDQRRLGMTWSPLGMVRSPATLRVMARLTLASADDGGADR